MLVLSRKKNESIIINDNITVTVIEIRGDKVRLGIEAPKHVTVHRREVYEAIQNQARLSIRMPTEFAPKPESSNRLSRAEPALARSPSRDASGRLRYSLLSRTDAAFSLASRLLRAFQQPNEFPHPRAVVGPASDRDERAVDDHLAVDELARPRRAGRARDRDSTSSSCRSRRRRPGAAAARDSWPRSVSAPRGSAARSRPPSAGSAGTPAPGPRAAPARRTPPARPRRGPGRPGRDSRASRCRCRIPARSRARPRWKTRFSGAAI